MTEGPYGEGIGRPIYAAGQISSAVGHLAREIAADHAGKPLLLLGVLKGALYLTVDLARELAGLAGGPSEIVVDYLCVTSYGASTQSSGEVRILTEAAAPIAGRHVVVVEDIVDGGLTLQFLRAFLGKRRPASLRTCALFDKPARRRVTVQVDYVGLGLPDTFVVGYGLDYQELYRNLPYLAELGPSKPIP